MESGANPRERETSMADGQETPLEFVTVAKVGALAEGTGGTFMAGDKLIALFLREGQYYAIDDLCPHMGASLGAGRMDGHGVVTCPWHAWRFSAFDGTWCDNPRIKINSYEVRIQGDDLQVCTTPRKKQP